MSFVATADGEMLSGLSRGVQDGMLVLIDSQGKELRIPEDDVEDTKLLEVSPMPTNLRELIPENEFYDLIAYLLSQSQAPTPAQ